MTRTETAVIAEFKNVPEKVRVGVLVRLCYDLTIVARDADARPSLEGICEIQHLALGQIMAYRSGSEHRYSDSDLIKVLVNTAVRFGLAHQVQHSISDYLSFHSDEIK